MVHPDQVRNRRFDLLGILADNNYLPDIILHHGTQRGEISTLALPTHDQNLGLLETTDRGQRGPHVGTLRIVDPAHTILVGQLFTAVLQTRKPAQGLEHLRGEFETKLADDRQGCQSIEPVLPALDSQGPCLDQLLLAARQPADPLFNHDTKLICTVRSVGTETHRAPTGDLRGAGFVTVDHFAAGIAIHPCLGVGISLVTGIAVHVVLAEVENHGHIGRQAVSGFKLETGELEYIYIGRRFRKQVERRDTDVTAQQGVPAGSPDHLVDQCRYGALAVGTGDGNDRRMRVTRKQLDIPDQFRLRPDSLT